MTPKISHSWLPALLLSAALLGPLSCMSGKSTPTTPSAGLELNSGDLASGSRFEHRFFLAGTYAYHCIHHAPMTGSVVVSDSAPDTLVRLSIISSTTSFPAASVKPGGRVVWANLTQDIHTVTSN